jgi:hypothetical protein
MMAIADDPNAFLIVGRCQHQCDSRRGHWYLLSVLCPKEVSSSFHQVQVSRTTRYTAYQSLIPGSLLATCLLELWMEELRLSLSSSTLQSSVPLETPMHSLNGTLRSILAVCMPNANPVSLRWGNDLKYSTDRCLLPDS